MVLIYDINNGNMSRQPLKGVHKGNINCIRFSNSGNRFATGSSDKLVVVW